MRCATNRVGILANELGHCDEAPDAARHEDGSANPHTDDASTVVRGTVLFPDLLHLIFAEQFLSGLLTNEWTRKRK